MALEDAGGGLRKEEARTRGKVREEVLRYRRRGWECAKVECALDAARPTPNPGKPDDGARGGCPSTIDKGCARLKTARRLGIVLATASGSTDRCAVVCNAGSSLYGCLWPVICSRYVTRPLANFHGRRNHHEWGCAQLVAQNKHQAHPEQSPAVLRRQALRDKFAPTGAGWTSRLARDHGANLLSQECRPAAAHPSRRVGPLPPVRDMGPFGDESGRHAARWKRDSTDLLRRSFNPSSRPSNRSNLATCASRSTAHWT